MFNAKEYMTQTSLNRPFSLKTEGETSFHSEIDRYLKTRMTLSLPSDAFGPLRMYADDMVTPFAGTVL